MSSDVLDRRMSRDEWPVVIRCYRRFLSSRIKASDIIMDMQSSISDGLTERIRSLDGQGRHVDAANTLFDYLLDSANCDDARWSQFDQALENKYFWIHEFVHGKYSEEDLEYQRKLIDFFSGNIIDNVDPTALAPKLLQKRLLKREECEVLYSRCKNEGASAGALYMISHIHRNSSYWYTEFLDILMIEHQELVRVIDEAEYSKRTQRALASMSDVQEAPMEVCSGSADVPRASLYAPAPGKRTGARTSVDGSTDNLNSSDSDGEPDASDGDSDIHEPQKKKKKLSTMDQSAGTCIAMVVAENGFKTDTAAVTTSLARHDVPLPDSTIDADKNNGDMASETTEAIKASGAASGEGAGTQEGEVAEEDVGKLRSYQEELARQAFGGKNVIICAPTGSGKTRIALEIIQNHLQQKGRGVRKVVFLVNQVALAAQQHSACEKFLTDFRCKLVSGDMSGATKVPLNELMPHSDVLVMTAQILLDALDKNEVKDISQFSMLVFDECHHTNSRHPFNCIMHHYMAMKFSTEDEEDDPYDKLPQVVGLTASVGVGKAADQGKAKTHIQKLCAHLDADYICTVKENMAELAKYSNDPTFEKYSCAGRPNDAFKGKIGEIMKIIEEQMQTSEFTQRIDSSTGIRAKLHPPSGRGTAQYTNWVTHLRNDVAMLNDAEARRFLVSSRRMLMFYNDALAINDDFDTEDALTYLKGKFKELFDAIGQQAAKIDKDLKDLFDTNMLFLEEKSKAQANTNQKLLKLEQLLLEKFGEEQESRAMVFVKTREMASALVNWMQRRPELKCLKPARMTGAGSSAEQGGMTKTMQVDVMEFFKKGDHRILVATSVAEEGLDIQKCNLVIRYNYVTNEIAMVQARGRARAADSKFVVLAGPDKGVEQKDEINLIREMMMNSAIRELQQEMEQQPERCKEQMEKIQKEEKTKRDFEMKQNRGKLKKAGEMELRCHHCDQFGCLSSFIRTINKKHHVVIDPSFRDRFKEEPFPKPVYYDDMVMKFKLLCKNCGLLWGNVNLYRDTKFPLIKIESFVAIDECNRRDAPKKWKDVKFIVQELTNEEFEQYSGLQVMEATAAE